MSQPLGCCMLVIKNNQVLLGKRKNSYKAGYYGLPGGRLEVGEKLAECAKRELQEETSLVANELEYVGVVKETQESYDFIHFIFKCEKFSGEPVCVEEEKCEGWEWFDLEKLPKPILSGHLAGIELLLSNHLQKVEI